MLYQQFVTLRFQRTLQAVKLNHKVPEDIKNLDKRHRVAELSGDPAALTA